MMQEIPWQEEMGQHARQQPGAASCSPAKLQSTGLPDMCVLKSQTQKWRLVCFFFFFFEDLLVW